MDALGARVADLARRQHGVVSREQLVGLGLTAAMIKRQVRSAHLHPVHRGVYLVGHSKPLPLALEMAAVLACGSRSVVSHRSAGKIWKLLERPSGPVEVTLVGTDRRPPDITVRHASALLRRDTRTRERIPLTSPARTILDLASILRPAALERALAEAQARNLVGRPDLRDQLRRNRGRPGSPSLRALVDGAAPAWTRSEAERRLLALIRAAGLPEAEANAPLGRYEVDFVWREQRVVVEFDSWRFHRSRRAFEADRRRDAELAACGYTVIRVTWRQLTEEPEAVVARIAAALARAQA